MAVTDASVTDRILDLRSLVPDKEAMHLTQSAWHGEKNPGSRALFS